MSADSARRASERRRRALGKAETPEHQRERYAANPEPGRAACRVYYADHREQVLASVSAYYTANRAEILARKRKAYAARSQASPAQYDLAAAADALSVIVTALCAQCSTAFTPRPGSPRRFCSPDCGMAHGRDIARQRQASGQRTAAAPRMLELPPAPDWSKGLCTTVKPSQRAWWTSGNRDEREAAAHYCAACPVREPCEQWSLALPVSDPAIYGGLSAAERRKRRRAWLEAIAAQVRA